MVLAIFDLDNTLLNGDSDHAWGEFLVEQQRVDAETYRQRNDAFYQDYQRGVLDINAYLEFALEPLARHTMNELTALHGVFMREKIAHMRLSKADALIASHKKRGHHLLIITATNRFVTAPIAASLGIDSLLATDPEILNDRYTGRIAGTPCFRDGKVKRLRQWLQEQSLGLDGSYFYSDSINDLPLLETVTHPVAVDPDDTLRGIAADRGWQILSRDTE